MATVESIRHLLLQCPSTLDERNAMYDKIRDIYPQFDDKCKEEPGEPILWLLGKPINGVNIDTMYDIWKVSGCTIFDIYKSAIKRREGIG